jgi:hypothetical protein
MSHGGRISREFLLRFLTEIRRRRKLAMLYCSACRGRDCPVPSSHQTSLFHLPLLPLKFLPTPCFHRLDAEVPVFRKGTLYSLTLLPSTRLGSPCIYVERALCTPCFPSTRRRSPCIQRRHSILPVSIDYRRRSPCI